jgi:hypothetical protein
MALSGCRSFDVVVETGNSNLGKVIPARHLPDMQEKCRDRAPCRGDGRVKEIVARMGRAWGELGRDFWPTPPRQPNKAAFARILGAKK